MPVPSLSIAACKWRYFLIRVVHAMQHYHCRNQKLSMFSIWSPAFQRAVQIIGLWVLLLCLCSVYKWFTSCFSRAAISSSLYSSSLRYYKICKVFFYISWILLDFHSIYVPSIPTFFPSTITILSLSVVGLLRFLFLIYDQSYGMLLCMFLKE